MTELSCAKMSSSGKRLLNMSSCDFSVLDGIFKALAVASALQLNRLYCLTRSLSNSSETDRIAMMGHPLLTAESILPSLVRFVARV